MSFLCTIDRSRPKDMHAKAVHNFSERTLQSIYHPSFIFPRLTLAKSSNARCILALPADTICSRKAVGEGDGARVL